MMRVITDPQIVARNLEADALLHIVLLKHLRAFPEQSRAVWIDEGSDYAALVLLDARTASYDRATYPGAQHVAIVAATQPVLIDALLDHVPKTGQIVFKLADTVHATVIARRWRIKRARAFLSFTATLPPAPAAGVEVGHQASGAMFALYSEQGHERAWLEALLTKDLAFTCEFKCDGRTAAVCLAYENYGRIWEVGGVVTVPAYREQGYGSRVVCGALGELHRRGLLPRYQVSEDNLASIALARSIGMTQFLTITHYLSA